MKKFLYFNTALEFRLVSLYVDDSNKLLYYE